jgi:murein L,D-transpeptidase YcbB/YkuD
MKLKFFQILSIAFVVSLIVTCADHVKTSKTAPVETNESPMATILENTLNNVNDSVQLAFGGEELFTTSLIKQFYKLNKNFPVWTSSMEPNKNAHELMDLFAKAQYFGLDTNFYQFTELKGLYNELENKNGQDLNKTAVDYELLMTHNCFKLMSNLHSGLLYADTSIYGANMTKYPSNFSQKLYNFISANNLTAGITNLQPKSYEYKRLIKGLEIFLNQTALSSETIQMVDPSIDSSMAYQNARKILIANNYLESSKLSHEKKFSVFVSIDDFNTNTSAEGFSYSSYEDSLFQNALKKFQKVHGLSPDGKIGYNTVKALQLNNRDRFEQIAINLERLRWEKSRPSRYVYVNLPAYKLRVIDNYSIVKTYNVVVGAQATETPLLNSKIEYIITNPEWNVPYSISSNELLPKIKKDSTYLARHNYRIYDKDRNPIKEINWATVEKSNFKYSIQQGAGSGNALGKIKFIFPNPYNVYIHDTQDKSKFSKDIRAYSHGCMRIQDPHEFAKTLLKLEPNNMADSVDTWLSRGNQKRISLPEPIPVFVRYVSCEADSDGKITFYHDIYGRDNKLKQKLFGKRNI